MKRAYLLIAVVLLAVFGLGMLAGGFLERRRPTTAGDDGAQAEMLRRWEAVKSWQEEMQRRAQEGAENYKAHADEVRDATLTVTGLKDFDYATLRDKPYLEVLQMANEDVTDQTLDHLKGLKRLRMLDLSNTQVTDDGLGVLKELPGLEVLHLNGTKVTDDGMRRNIFPIETLTELSLLRTKVTKKTRDEWRAAKQGRKVAPVF
jgi:hypothetical protein